MATEIRGLFADAKSALDSAKDKMDFITITFQEMADHFGFVFYATDRKMSHDMTPFQSGYETLGVDLERGEVVIAGRPDGPINQIHETLLAGNIEHNRVKNCIRMDLDIALMKLSAALKATDYKGNPPKNRYIRRAIAFRANSSARSFSA